MNEDKLEFPWGGRGVRGCKIKTFPDGVWLLIVILALIGTGWISVQYNID